MPNPACISIRRHARSARPPQALASEKLANRIDLPRAPVAASAPPSRAKKLQLWGPKKLQSEQLARANSLIKMPGATGLEPATFGVTGRLINKLKQCFLKLFCTPRFYPQQALVGMG